MTDTSLPLSTGLIVETTRAPRWANTFGERVCNAPKQASMKQIHNSNKSRDISISAYSYNCKSGFVAIVYVLRSVATLPNDVLEIIKKQINGWLLKTKEALQAERLSSSDWELVLMPLEKVVAPVISGFAVLERMWQMVCFRKVKRESPDNIPRHCKKPAKSAF